jgi:hypothetical protein
LRLKEMGGNAWTSALFAEMLAMEVDGTDAAQCSGLRFQVCAGGHEMPSFAVALEVAADPASGRVKG